MLLLLPKAESDDEQDLSVDHIQSVNEQQMASAIDKLAVTSTTSSAVFQSQGEDGSLIVLSIRRVLWDDTSTKIMGEGKSDR